MSFVCGPTERAAGSPWAAPANSHCLVIDFAADPPSNLWPKGIAACSHAEWAGSRTLAERKAARWRKETQGRPLAQGLVCVEAIEILEARQV
jgi:hypothetical protein